MTTLKKQLREDLTAAMRAKDTVRKGAIRMALTAIGNEEVAGDTARELSDDEVLKILTREVKKRREAAEAFDAGGRAESAAQERAEGDILAEYLPKQLTDDELTALVAEAVAESGASGPKAMGPVMKLANAKVAGRADGRRVADAVKAALAG
ncbi:glutamyl-tRNA amidotransferase [Mangrovactinospora gilvigrisea]|uniref:Glutamyl-tRNA amidotransferase n=1 Tax=Mangrovactinospora gilvigrisea TaxID=1428644 RepID=A0A1J7BGS6_9ACTN|nr:GatB/YqeY domain-containing protein [Mangrovactinospora gilvigrisea]OIV37854.1 glutamyl-tRNA amidotransferase [Mangrovactinospora gilvigrisea]